jgi:hypothetical protein
MSHSGSFGINSTRTWTLAQLGSSGTGAKLLDAGTDKRGQWVFVKASAAIAQYAFVGIDGEGDAAELTTTTYAASAQIGVAQVAFASADYGWVWVGGEGGGGTGVGIKGLFSANYAAFAVINTTATAGVVDDAATKILGGVVGLTLVGGVQASAELQSASTIIKVTA